MSYVKEVTRKVKYRKKFDARLGTTQLYDEEKELVLDAVRKYDFESISAFVRDAIRTQLANMGYDVPAEESFLFDELPAP